MRPYDPTKIALLSPERADTVFTAGATPADVPLAVEAARLAYLRIEESPAEMQRLKNTLGLVGFENVKPFNHMGTDGQGFGAVSGGRALLAFRGTQPDRISALLGSETWISSPASTASRRFTASSTAATLSRRSRRR